MRASDRTNSWSRMAFALSVFTMAIGTAIGCTDSNESTDACRGSACRIKDVDGSVRASGGFDGSGGSSFGAGSHGGESTGVGGRSLLGTGGKDAGTPEAGPDKPPGRITVSGTVSYYGLPAQKTTVQVDTRTFVTDDSGHFVATNVLVPYDATVLFEQYKAVFRMEGLMRADPILNCTSCPVPDTIKRTAHVTGTIERVGDAGQADSGAVDRPQLSVQISDEIQFLYGSWSGNRFLIYVDWVGPVTVSGQLDIRTVVGSPCGGHLTGYATRSVTLTDQVVLSLDPTPVPAVQERVIDATVSGPYYPPHDEQSPDAPIAYGSFGCQPGLHCDTTHIPPPPVAVRGVEARCTAEGSWTRLGMVSAESVSISRALGIDATALQLVMPQQTGLGRLPIGDSGTFANGFQIYPSFPSYQTVSMTIGVWDVELVTDGEAVGPPTYVPGYRGGDFCAKTVRSRTGSVDAVASGSSSHADVEYDAITHIGCGF